MKKLLSGVFVLVVVLFSACTEDIDTSARYVFKEETIASYLSKHEQYSEYYRLLGEMEVSNITETSVLQLLTARGHYTVFAPTNEAIQRYLDTLVTTGLSWEGFPSERKRDSIKQVIVYNSIIDSGDDYNYFEINAFPVPTATSKSVQFNMPNMNDRKLTVQHTDNGDTLYINDCLIDVNNRDILCINGVVHAMHSVVAPSDNTMDILLRKYMEDENSGYVVSAKIAQMLTPDTMNAEVEIVFQTIENLHIACPNDTGDWYFTGHYPTPGGIRLCNEAFVNYVEKVLKMQL